MLTQFSQCKVVDLPVTLVSPLGVSGFFSCIKQYKNEFGHSSDISMSIEIQLGSWENNAKPFSFSSRLQFSQNLGKYTGNQEQIYVFLKLQLSNPNKPKYQN